MRSEIFFSRAESQFAAQIDGGTNHPLRCPIAAVKGRRQLGDRYQLVAILLGYKSNRAREANSLHATVLTTKDNLSEFGRPLWTYRGSIERTEQGVYVIADVRTPAQNAVERHLKPARTEIRLNLDSQQPPSVWGNVLLQLTDIHRYDAAS